MEQKHSLSPCNYRRFLFVSCFGFVWNDQDCQRMRHYTHLYTWQAGLYFRRALTHELVWGVGEYALTEPGIGFRLLSRSSLPAFQPRGPKLTPDIFYGMTCLPFVLPDAKRYTLHFLLPESHGHSLLMQDWVNWPFQPLFWALPLFLQATNTDSIVMS